VRANEKEGRERPTVLAGWAATLCATASWLDLHALYHLVLPLFLLRFFLSLTLPPPLLNILLVNFVLCP
jgi:hypothetical protein